ncbi:MAG: zinc ribbon domain-containing protein [Anaerolineaceae bacterium]|nr:zinc ribbon domain-containing protein [Anaerolineaceae bacterium]
MINYYDLLQLPQSASTQEIEIKLDEQYQKWRGLVTHHKPEIVDEANNALRTIENARTTLLNAENRSEYDKQLTAAIGNQAGLSDPDAFFTSPGSNFGGNFSAIPPQSPSPILPQAERTDAWICPNPACKKANSVGTTFCSNCGETLGKACPNCGELVEASNKFCSKCGVDKLATFEEIKQSKLRDLQKEKRILHEKLDLASTDKSEFLKQYPTSLPKYEPGCSWITLPLILMLITGGYLAYLSGIRDLPAFIVLLPTAVFLVTQSLQGFIQKHRWKLKKMNEDVIPGLKRSIESNDEEIIKTKRLMY